jgi:hypothetical protein
LICEDSLNCQINPHKQTPNQSDCKHFFIISDKPLSISRSAVQKIEKGTKQNEIRKIFSQIFKQKNQFLKFIDNVDLLFRKSDIQSERRQKDAILRSIKPEGFSEVIWMNE